MSPDYFKRELRPYEAEHYLEGVMMRKHDGWEQTRVVYDMLRGKDSKPMTFPWEDGKPQPEEPTQEVLDDLYDWTEVTLKKIQHG